MTKTTYDFDLLSLGEIVVDFISTEIVTTLESAAIFQRFSGGEAANLAINMAKLGNTSSLAACVGKDGFGQFVKTHLKEGGVNTQHLQTVPDAPTTAIAISRQIQTPDFIVYRGADSQLTLTEGLKKAVKESKAIHTSAFALSQSPTRETVLTLLELAHEEGKLISLDPNYHPHIWPDRPDFKSFLKKSFQYVKVTKPSLEDCTRLFGPGNTPEEYAGFFLDLGPKIVALTMGRKGVLLATANGERYRIQPTPISVADVTGAGDAFWSGLLTALLNGATPLEAAKLGQTVAEFKIGIMGPVTAYPSLEDLWEKAQTIKVSTP